MMRYSIWFACIAALTMGLIPKDAAAQRRTFTWQEIKDRFEASNPTLLAGRFTIDESRAEEIGAYLRPNPDFTAVADQIEPFTTDPYRPLGFLLNVFSISYLHEREHKRELRLSSAQQGTMIAESQQADLERNLLFNL